MTFAADANKWRPLGLKAQQLVRGGGGGGASGSKREQAHTVDSNYTGCVQI